MATGMANLAMILVAKSDLGAAEPLLQRALAMQRKFHGDETPEVVATMNNLASSVHSRLAVSFGDLCMLDRVHPNEMIWALH